MNYYKSKGQTFVFRPVNRLDKGTSGIMIIAKNPYVHELFKNQLHTNEFQREYLAVVEGVIEGDGFVEAPIFRDKSSTIKRVVDSRGSYSYTQYFVEKHLKDKTLVKLKLRTGRTHQIRVHMSYISHPLYGDFLYGTQAVDITRPALHSYKVDFIHPITKEHLTFTSELPEDITKIITASEL